MVKASNKRRGVDSRKEWNRQKMVELSNEKIEEILHKETPLEGSRKSSKNYRIIIAFCSVHAKRKEKQ